MFEDVKDHIVPGACGDGFFRLVDGEDGVGVEKLEGGCGGSISRYGFMAKCDGQRIVLHHIPWHRK